MSSEYKFILEPYTGMSSRYDCPHCGAKKNFVRYIDTETGQHVGDDVGRCNSEIHCGFHKKPESNGIALNVMPKFIQSRKPTPLNKLLGTLVVSDNLAVFLISIFGAESVQYAYENYMVASDSTKWNNATVFYQQDEHHVAWAGKVMLYDKDTGKRVKHPYPKLTWIHSVTGQEDYVMEQHLFGEHLIRNNQDVKYVLVESEKTALIGSIIEPDYVWLASGGMSNLNAKKLSVLSGKNVMAIADSGGYDMWNKKLSPLGISVMNLDSYEEGFDIADVWLEEIKLGTRKIK